MKRVNSGFSQHVLVLLAFVGLSIAMTWPLVMHMQTHLINAKWFYDAMTNITILGTRTQYVLGQSPLGLYENYFCFPVPFSIVFNENLFGLSLLYLPIYLATGEYLLSYNILLLLCLALSGYCTWLFVRHLTGSSLAGFVAGVGFAFCPYIFFELGRIQLVAAMWVPLCAFFLHRTIESDRLRDMVGLGICFLMQIGTCLYYALFLLLFFAFVGSWLLIVHKRFGKEFWLRLVAVVLLSGVVASFMVYPYFKTRDDITLTRSTSKARQYSGKISSFVHVYPENKTLQFLHFDSLDGSEQVAFPGFSIAVLALLSFAFALAKAYRRGPPQEMRGHITAVVVLSLLVFFSSLGATVVFGEFLAAIPIIVGSIIYWKRRTDKIFLPSTIALYGCFILFATVLFLGIRPMNVNDRPIYGLYDYLYDHVPGFDGIRYVSRQIILVMLGLVVLAGFAAADIFRSIRRPGRRMAVFGGLTFIILVEFLNAPVSLEEIPIRDTLPGSYKWLRKHRGEEPLAIIPGHYLGYFGALHNYYALYHRRRTLNGKSSWIPPITRLYIHEMRRFPRRSGKHLLDTFGVKYLIVQTDELRPDHASRMIAYLRKNGDQYRLIYGSDKDYLFEIINSDKPKLITATPPLPNDAIPLHNWQLAGTASRRARDAQFAFDRDPLTSWNTGRVQMPGDWFEYRFKQTEKIVAIDLKDNQFILDLPYSFSLSASLSRDDTKTNKWKTIVSRPNISLSRDLVYSPRNALFRIPLPKPTPAKRLRIELVDSVPGHFWTITESVIWIKR